MRKTLNRRNFINTLSAAGAGLAVGVPKFSFAHKEDAKPALLGGPKAHPGEFPSWPLFTTTASYQPGAGTRATNLRMTEMQGSLLLSQMTRVAGQSKLRSGNAAYLTQLFNEIPGIRPAKLYDGTTNSAFHLYMFRYDKNQFAGLSREKFLKALEAEGVPCASGYGKMNKNAYVTGLAKNKHFLKIYGEKAMQEWLLRNECPQNDTLTEEAVWFYQTMLIGTRSDMEQIAVSVRKIQKYAAEIAKA